MSTPAITPFEALLERFATAVATGDHALADRLRAVITTNLAARENALGL